MTYLQAVEEMKVLANGEYWTLDHQTDSHGARIRGYIVPFGHAMVAATYREAIENVRRMLGMAGSDPAPEDGIPVLKPIETKLREFSSAVIEETMTKNNEEYQRRGE